MVLSKSILIFSSMSLLLACERIPEWEKRDDLSLQSSESLSLKGLESWMWTCRATQVSYRMGAENELSGKSIEAYMEPYRNSGLAVVDPFGEKTILGTGILWDAQGHVLTLQSWVSQSKDLECRGGGTNWIKAEVVGEDGPLNLALLKVNLLPLAKQYSSSRRWVGRYEEPGFEEKLYLISSSYPGVMDRIPVELQISRSPLFTGLDEALILFSPPPPQAFMASILVDKKSRVLGFVFPPKSTYWGTAIKMERLDTLVEYMIKLGRVERAFIGMRLSFQDQEGFRVTDVEVGGPAYKAGVRANDIVKQWDGRDLKAMNDWPKISFTDKGRSLNLVYTRGSSEVETVIHIGANR
ncbi:MAG: hypothetical protein COV44_06530 [Deltaproteobacteria bacterium CG11_big_fil_rev_8_21_14_0_20_45_16]|nr:MAG: hypothetical protein COV44_06530 [Deltaproteobacteria bacterium CG11_big_fil_rev_8_21_14_0_20_45_16]